jgi:hypothetical protein
VGRSLIVTREDVVARYPDAPEDFAPTHRVEVSDPRAGRVIRQDLVVLADADGEIAYARDGHGEEVYGVLSTGLWQCFETHGRITVRDVRYRARYVPVNEREGLVYFVQAGEDGPIKIGWSQHLDHRKASLQTANAHKLRVLGTVPGTRRREAALHAQFAHLRMEGGEEWFRNSFEIHEFLRNAVKTL